MHVSPQSLGIIVLRFEVCNLDRLCAGSVHIEKHYKYICIISKLLESYKIDSECYICLM